MKARQLIILIAIIVTSFGLTFQGCKKSKTTDQTTNDKTTSLQQLTNDENKAENNSDEAMNDVNSVLSPGGGLKSAQFIPCNATVDSAVVHDTILTFYIRYHGYNCNNTKIITGNIEISKNVNVNWHVAGATVLVKFIDYKVVRVANGKSMTFNGTKTFTNVSGGFIWQLGFPGHPAMIEKVTGSILVTFDDNTTTKTWNIARQRTLTRTVTADSVPHLVLTIDGFGSDAGYNNLVFWGVNRNGENFYTQINQSVVIKEACSWDPCSGVELFTIPGASKSATVTFGYDSNNDPVSGDNCPTRYRIDWTVNGQSGTFFLPL
ncbi:MAG: hypothetical protein NTX61_17525 [Bacteroidetes bacterium]|nr:hypothetical protein [Bacteroidota bacterium]